MAKVGIVMGSDSDMPVMSKAADILEKLGIDYEMKIISAHREPDVFFEYAKTAEEKGFKVIIAGAGMAAHLPGMCAAIFPMPVIGIPYNLSGRKRFPLLNRTDAKRYPGCYSSDQWWRQCGTSCCQDPCNFRRRASFQTEILQSGAEGAG
mgnify:CR=1 FL=1